VLWLSTGSQNIRSGALARKVARRFVHFLVPRTLMIVSAAPLILIPFGEDYVREGSPVLRVLACACVFHRANRAVHIGRSSPRSRPSASRRQRCTDSATDSLNAHPGRSIRLGRRCVGLARHELSCRVVDSAVALPFRRSQSEDEIGVGANGLPSPAETTESLNMQEG
jgi:hypothetical protein